ncbi:NAD-dependent epimerase/dehydratase family protein [Oscillochloris sp. ZM17-4]|uniref:NAD-dependent epimerase/dehydratase family protein n=1 Tax=Oscillochloris sp. ZM17-4 TaxID=2866714 RepID=UPI001C72E2F3|nr:NAD-dependent epimerase/dehydratase family protein [Oscillochloris sp. ZM17-4]MBX0326260.1 NAD-dependent epimerase/dehydratase family protein [Oscillochloris sp. ZM17-4]
MTTQETHVVLGSGPLGMATVEALLRRGHIVRIVNRSGQAEAPAGAAVVRADLYDQASVRAVAEGAAAVYQCAQPGYAEWVAKFPPLQTAIIAGAAAAGAKLIVAENLYMYGQVDGPIHEDLPYAAHTRKGRVRAQMAEQVAAAHRSGQLRAASARGSDFYGPGVLGSSLGERVFQPALAGKAAQATGRLDLPHSYTYIGDFGETMAILGEREDALGRHWHVPSAAPLTQRELIGLIYQELGLEPKMSGMGRLMMTLGGLFIPEARETVEMMYEFERPFVVDSSRAEAAFGQRPTPLAEGVRRTVAWYRAHHAALPIAA